MKYYQQSLSSLAKNASGIEKKNIRALCLKFIEKAKLILPYLILYPAMTKLDPRLSVWR